MTNKVAQVRLGYGLVLAALSGLGACKQQTVDAKLRSLQASGDVAFVCRNVDGGVTMDHCPDVDNDPPQTVLDALVTQTATNEIAIVDVNHAVVVDVDASIPGYNFLRLPSRPGDIVSTPGGTATFVGLTTSGKTGVSVIPTTCVGPPRTAELAEGIRQSERDVTTFPACSLPSIPGDLALVVEPPSADGVVAASCDDPETPETAPPGGTRFSVLDVATSQDCSAAGGVWYLNSEADPPAYECRLPNGRDCVADLTKEGGPPGRRKLIVSLPDEGRVVVIDAQGILDREPGSFAPCAIERTLPLMTTADASGQSQSVPPELVRPAGCMLDSPTSPPVPPSGVSRPSGFGTAEGRLYVGDLGVPLVHALDTSSACNLHEIPPLLPMSFVHPNRVVTTTRVAATPTTPSGKQYVYAVDATDQQTTSVMIFDVSDGVTNRTPLIRAGSDRQPREQPDRIEFPAPVADITFALRDLPFSDPDTGVAEVGALCDPDPSLPVNPASPGVQYRTSGDRTQGARPRLLRGLFGLVLLTNGRMHVVDVDDFDVRCRRPRYTNALMTPDFRGCANDPAGLDYYTYALDADGNPMPGEVNDTRTVSDEVSCNMVEPHRLRSAAFGIADASLGIAAPSLRALPRFDTPTYQPSVAVQDRPKLLAVPFTSPDGGEGVPPETYVGTTLFEPSSQSAKLPTAPEAGEDQSGITLPPTEPRSYPSSDHNVLTYEGRVTSGDFPSGFIDMSALTDTEPGVLTDGAAFFCGNAIYDEAAMADYAREELGLSDAESQIFSAGTADLPELGHADYVQITGDYPSITDPYWQSARGLSGGGRDACLTYFGRPPNQAEDLSQRRDFRILEAYQDHLVIRPRRNPKVTADPDKYPAGSPEDDKETDLYNKQVAELAAFPDTMKTMLGYCFPSGVRYTVRGANQWVLSNGTPAWLHDTVVDHAQRDRCVRDCDPRKRWFRSRVFEIGTTKVCGPDKSADACAATGVGLATDTDGPCRYDPVTSVTRAEPDADGNTPIVTVGVRGVGLDEPTGAHRCIFENLTSRFAMYRGHLPSLRDMTFVWDQTGGFYPLVGSLASESSVVLPQHLSYIPEFQSIAIVDGASLGLSIMTLDSLSVATPWPVF
jgi:hypothetical protein